MPKSVGWFEKLAWLALLIGMLVNWLDWTRMVTHAVHRSLDTRIPIIFLEREYKAMSSAMLAIAVGTIAVSLILIWLPARRRKNWARWVYAVSFVVPLSAALRLPDLFSANPTAAALSIVQYVVQIAAMAMLFLPGAGPWFAKPMAGP